MYAEGSTEKMTFEEVTVTNRSCIFIGLPGGEGKLETLPLKAHQVQACSSNSNQWPELSSPNSNSKAPNALRR